MGVCAVAGSMELAHTSAPHIRGGLFFLCTVGGVGWCRAVMGEFMCAYLCRLCIWGQVEQHTELVGGR